MFLFRIFFSFKQKFTILYKVISIGRRKNNNVKKFVLTIFGSLLLILASFTPLDVQVYKLRTIVIDAGHGGKDKGAYWYGISEKTLTLNVASVEQVFVSTSPRAALVLGQARGVALAALAALGVGVEEYAASSIKQSVTGSGRAPKRQVQQMVGRLLALERKPATDAADALAAAICHAHAGRRVGIGAARARGSRAARAGALHVRRRL